MANLPDYIKTAESPFPKKIFWKVIAGPPLSEIQSYDIVYDEKDLRIRGMEMDVTTKEIRFKRPKDHRYR